MKEPPPRDETSAEYNSVLITTVCSGTTEEVGWLEVSLGFSSVNLGLGFSFSRVGAFVYRESGVSGLGGEGETISIYLGVSIKTRDIRKNAKRVFLSISYLTGSSPPLNRGLHLRILVEII